MRVFVLLLVCTVFCCNVLEACYVVLLGRAPEIPAPPAGRCHQDMKGVTLLKSVVAKQIDHW
jgi:hypothetical protein